FAVDYTVTNARLGEIRALVEPGRDRGDEEEHTERRENNLTDERPDHVPACSDSVEARSVMFQRVREGPCRTPPRRTSTATASKANTSTNATVKSASTTTARASARSAIGIATMVATTLWTRLAFVGQPSERVF